MDVEAELETPVLEADTLVLDVLAPPVLEPLALVLVALLGPPDELALCPPVPLALEVAFT